MDYLWLKAFHIVAAIVWIGGMLMAALTLSAFSGHDGEPGSPTRSSLLAAARRSDRMVTSPAMLVVWVLGLTLALKGGWFPDPWLLIKIALVVLLSAFHGMLSGRLRRLATPDETYVPRELRYAPLVIVGGVTAIVVLVVTKPL